MSNYDGCCNEEYKPISSWGYVGYEILFAIPVLGFLCALFMAIGARNKNVKNFARAQFCVILLAIILGVILGLLGIGGEFLSSLT